MLCRTLCAHRVVFVLQLFHFWINTAYIESNYLCFDKQSLDKACKVCVHFLATGT